MTQEEIYNGNVEIAKMLGWVEMTIQDKLKWAGLDIEERLNNIKKEYIPILKAEKPSGWTDYIFPDFSTFDCSQDWACLMHTIEFIEKINNIWITIEINKCKIEYSKYDYVQGLAKSTKQAVFIAVSQFAKMYNNKLV